MANSNWFQRVILPGLAFKAVVIGGGYATGRELAEFFLHSGPLGGVLGLIVTMLLWSLICTTTFLFARLTGSLDYRSFFKALLGRFWPLFEFVYIGLMLLVISVFGAAAGEIAERVFGFPPVLGMLALGSGIIGVATFGNHSVERLFKYVSALLYLTYAVFLALAFLRFGDRIADRFAASPAPTGWVAGGLTYGSYNLLSAVAILPFVRHMRGKRDAVIAGILCGPLAILPGLLFFVAMAGFYPEIGDATLPSDFLLGRMAVPAFHVLFQIMVLAALLEGGTGLVHSLNERIAGTVVLARKGRFVISAAIVTFGMFVAARIGLIALIATGYKTSALVLIVIYVVPLLTIGLWRILANRNVIEAIPAAAEGRNARA